MRSLRDLTRIIGIQFPIIQAPMAGGATTPELVAAVSNAGGLGSLGAGYMTSVDIRFAIKKIRTLTHKPFAVNLFIHQAYQVNDEEMAQACEIVQQSCQELGVQISSVEPPYAPQFEEQVQVIIEEKVPVFSFTFGIPDSQWIQKLNKNKTILIGTATNVEEARQLEVAGIDSIVAQGSEAGGHRGTFIGKPEDSLIPLADLLAQLLGALSIPVVAAGGMMNAKHIVTSLSQGAAAVQMGTAFLTCVESGIHTSYKQVLLATTEDNTTLTRAFSGKLARGICNKFVERLATHQEHILDYPIQNALTRSMRKEAEKQNNTDFMSVWAGQFVYLGKETTVADLMNELIRG